MSSNFVMPKQIISGAGALNNAKDVFKKAGKKALIVSGKVMEKVGNVAKVTKILDELSIEYAIYTDITGEPTDVMIEGGLKVYKEEKLLERVFTPQMYLLPISTDEINKNKGTLLQTETWR